MDSADSMTHRQKTLALLTLIVALVLEIVDLTIVNTALPAIKADIGADAEASQWIVAAYAMAFALFLMAGGRLGDSFGYRRIFLIGVAGFTASSVLCGLAATSEQLVAARLLQGATGAVMSPQFMAMMQVLFTPLERVSKLALFGLIGGLAAIAGPIIGGLLIEADLLGLGWRVIFLINLPVGLIALVAGRLWLPTTRSARPAGYDLMGMVLFGGAVAAAIVPLMRAEGNGWTALGTLSLALGLLLGWLGWRHVAGRVSAGRAALFDPALFAIRSFRLGLILAIIFSLSSAGFLLVFAFALQVERGATPLTTGLLHMPFGFGAMFGIAVLGRRFLPRIGRWIMVAGAVTMAVGSVLALVVIGQTTASHLVMVPLLFVAGAGMGMISGCVPPVTVAQVDRDHAGAASALLKTCQQFGSAIGVALVGAVYFGWSRDAAVAPSAAGGGVVGAALLVCALIAAWLPADIFSKSLPAEKA